MDQKLEIRFYKRRTNPTRWEPNAIYAILPQNINETTVWITDTQGIPIKIIDVAGGGVNSVTGTGVTGTALNPKVDIATFVSTQLGNRIYLSTDDGKLQVNQITSPDGSLTINNAATQTQIELSSAISTLIGSALQPGDDVSDLTNDAGYITLSDIPAFVPSDYDLMDFTNNDSDPFVRESEIPAGSTNLSYTASPTDGKVNSDTGTDATIPLADNTNAGLLSPGEKTSIASALQPGDNISELNNDAGYITSTDLPATTDDVPEGSTNLYHTAARVLATVLSGFSAASGGAVVSTDTVLQAFGKIQNTLNNIFSASVFGAGINSQTGKTTPVDADSIPISDSAASNAAKKVTFANLKAWIISSLQSMFDAKADKPIYEVLTSPTLHSMAGGTLSPIFNLSPTIPVGTYQVDINFSFSNAPPGGTTISLGFTGTATTSLISLVAVGNKNVRTASNASSATQLTTAAPTVVTVSNAATEGKYTITGTVVVTGAGTFRPAFTFSTTATNAEADIGSMSIFRRLS